MNLKEKIYTIKENINRISSYDVETNIVPATVALADHIKRKDKSKIKKEIDYIRKWLKEIERDYR